MPLSDYDLRKMQELFDSFLSAMPKQNYNVKKMERYFKLLVDEVKRLQNEKRKPD